MKKEIKSRKRSNCRKSRSTNVTKKETKSVDISKNVNDTNLRDISNEYSNYCVNFNIFGNLRFDEKLFLKKFGLIATDEIAEKRINKYYSKELREIILNKYIKPQFFKQIRKIKKNQFIDNDEQIITVYVDIFAIKIKIISLYSKLFNEHLYTMCINKMDVFTLIKYIYSINIDISGDKNPYYKYLRYSLKGFIYETYQNSNNVSFGYFINSKNDNKKIASSLSSSNYLTAIFRIKNAFKRTKVLKFKF